MFQNCGIWDLRKEMQAHNMFLKSISHYLPSGGLGGRNQRLAFFTKPTEPRLCGSTCKEGHFGCGIGLTLVLYSCGTKGAVPALETQ